MFTDPFSKKAKELSARFDFATINKDTVELKKLLKEAEDILDEENPASQAMLYYSLGTAHDDFARLTGNINEKSFQKVLYFLEKALS